MKKTTIVSAIMLSIAAMMLSGCLFPYWDDEGRGGHGGHGGGHDEYRGEGHHEDRERR